VLPHRALMQVIGKARRRHVHEPAKESSACPPPRRVRPGPPMPGRAPHGAPAPAREAPADARAEILRPRVLRGGFRPGFKISKFRPNFTKFGNFGAGRKKTPKFFNTLIHVLYNSNLIFFYCLYCIFFYLIDM